MGSLDKKPAFMKIPVKSITENYPLLQRMQELTLTGNDYCACAALAMTWMWGLGWGMCSMMGY